MADSSEKYVEIYLSYNDCESDVIGSLLTQEDIPFILRDQRISPYPMNVDRFGERRFAVPESEAQRAKDLIADAIDSGAIMGEGEFKEIGEK
jgi:hypothetical protein